MPKNMYRISVHIRNGGNFMFNKKEEKVSAEKVNEVLTLTKKILKIVF